MTEATFVLSTICASKDSEEQLEEQSEEGYAKILQVEKPCGSFSLVVNNESVCYFVLDEYPILESQCYTLV